MKEIKTILVANRGEIAIRIFRACKELGIKSIAIYSEEDKNSLYRTIADESYRVGKGKTPVDAYLDISGIITLAKSKGVDAIHPGYGFLSENAEFAQACEEAGIEFIGPDHNMLNALGDKIQSKKVAIEVGVPTIPGVERAALNVEEAKEFAKVAGYPVILKASAGGGGRGMRVVRSEEDMEQEYNSATSEAKKAFGIADVFVEKYIERPKHIEVQVLGDKYGNIIHMFERDCSIQRRHQKVIEFAPSLILSEKQRQAICEDALKIARHVNYRSAGTVEFLVDAQGNHYFIEMNPRIQVEHCVTEQITGIDIVQAQIRVAQGYKLADPEIGIPTQDSITHRGYAIQCRVTTEDPANNFAPDTGTIEVYRSSSGHGIRLDSGNAYAGAQISPFYDSLLVKIIAYNRTFQGTIDTAIRCLHETKIKGVKTNIGFLINVLNHPRFRNGECDTSFIAQTPELFDIHGGDNMEKKMLTFLANKAVNEIKGEKPEFNELEVPTFDKPLLLRGTKQLLDEKGPKAVADWVMQQDRLLITDTSMRDAQQSLLATRMRTVDMTRIAPAYATACKDFFSLEMWGGATFDTAYRFLKESPWARLDELREAIPNVLFQMLLRGANAVGYANYPDNVIRQFVQESAKSGIDVFRIFDSLNWVEAMKVSIDEALKTDKLVEGCICYTGDIMDKSRTKYDLEYYIRKAKELEGLGCHMLGIKDMSGLLKPMAATELISALKSELNIPIHLHTHDSTGNGVATLLMAAQAGVDIVDVAFNGIAGLTSQPGLNSLVAALELTKRDTGLDIIKLQKISDYWGEVRKYYSQFESGMRAGSAEIYKYEIPGGQYSNLKPQVESFGLGHKFEEVKKMYATVNEMLGDIVKVTPSSKAVGDMAIFMVQNNLTPDNIIEKGKNIDFPDSIVSYFQGMMGQPEGGFPEDLQKIVLKDKEPLTCRPGELLPDEDLEADAEYLKKEYGIEAGRREALSYAMYPRMYEDYLKGLKKDPILCHMDSDQFFYGLRKGETGDIAIDEGKVMSVRLIEVKEPDEEGNSVVAFEVNGSYRTVKVANEAAAKSLTIVRKPMADQDNPAHVGANIPGTVIKILVAEGDEVEENQPLIVLEAMKMETNVLSPRKGKVARILAEDGAQVEAGELIVELEV